MKFKPFNFRKLKYRFIMKLILSFALLNSIFMFLMRVPQEESAIHETPTPQSITQERKQVVRKKGIYFHMFGEENEVKLAIPIWEMMNVKIQYYVAHRPNTSLPQIAPDNRNIIYYEEKNQRSLKEDTALIIEHNGYEGQWNIILNPNIMVNRTAVLDELSKCRWYYPVLLTYSFGEQSDDLDIFDSYNYELTILSASMTEVLHSNTELGLDRIGKYWTNHFIQTDAIVTSSICSHIGQDCAFLPNSIIYKVGSLELLPHVLLLLMRNEKRTKSSLLTDTARKYATSLTRIPHKYLHEARELYDREVEWGSMEAAKWKRMTLLQECKELGSVPRPDCYLTSLVEGSMPIGKGGVWEWKVVQAFTQFSLEGGEEYLVWLEKRGGLYFLFRFMGEVDMLSSQDLLRPLKQRKLLIIQSGQLDSEAILDRYQDLLEEQEVHLTTTRYPLLFTIDLILLLDQRTEDNLTQQLNEIKSFFPEIEARFKKGEITNENLLQLVSHLELNDVLAVNILNKKLNYTAIERCFSITSLELFMLYDSDGGTCIAVGDAIRTLKLKFRHFSLESISKLSDVKILRIPLSIRYDGI